MIYFHFHYFVIADKSPSHNFFSGRRVDLSLIFHITRWAPVQTASGRGVDLALSLPPSHKGGLGKGGGVKGGSGMGGDHECSRRCQELHLSLLYFVADCVSTPHMAQAISDVVG